MEDDVFALAGAEGTGVEAKECRRSVFHLGAPAFSSNCCEERGKESEGLNCVPAATIGGISAGLLMRRASAATNADIPPPES